MHRENSFLLSQYIYESCSLNVTYHALLSLNSCLEHRNILLQHAQLFRDSMTTFNSEYEKR